ncbi:MAG: hypothetical protein HOD92_09555 [Deltaproteobacteria bacterium]|jgi:hypothetical protein|nr:hypothetical protein [Deltaproteobacteria bacterium]MBT4526306.1 hypothetical protein [Deltaproteobacteria bacterium]
MKIRIEDGLPFVSVTISFQQQQMELKNVILDTGSAGTIFKYNAVKSIGIQQDANDEIHRICGVRGKEFVFTKHIDNIIMNDAEVVGFKAEIGTMEYGFPIDGILGLDFLSKIGAKIDLKEFQITT